LVPVCSGKCSFHHSLFFVTDPTLSHSGSRPHCSLQVRLVVRALSICDLVFPWPFPPSFFSPVSVSSFFWFLLRKIPAFLRFDRLLMPFFFFSLQVTGDFPSIMLSVQISAYWLFQTFSMVRRPSSPYLRGLPRRLFPFCPFVS